MAGKRGPRSHAGQGRESGFCGRCFWGQNRANLFLRAPVMRLEPLAQKLEVAAAQRVHHRGVLVARPGLASRRVQRRALVAFGQVEQSGDGAQEVPVAAIAVESEVKSAVFVHVPLDIRFRILNGEAGVDRLQFLDASRREARPARAQRHLLEAFPQGIEFDEIANRMGGDNSTAVRAQVNEAALRQSLDRLPDGMTADIELLGEADLIEAFPCGELACQYHPLDL